MSLDLNTIPVVPQGTCSSILWRGSPGLIGYESLAARDSLTGMHFDDMYSLELVCQGLQEIHLDGIWRPVPPLHVIWTSPHVVHAHHLFTELETIFVLFPTEMVEQVWRELYKDRPLQAPHAMIIPCPPQLQHALSHLLQEVRSCHPTSHYIISLLLHLVLAEFLRSAAHPALPLPSVHAQSSLLEDMSDVMCNAIRLLEQGHDCSSLALEGIAQTVGLSFFHFSRRFKQEIGVTPGHYLRQQRLNHALQLLFSTTLSLEEISYQSGFGSSRQLAEACKAAFGQVPSLLRKTDGFFFLLPPLSGSLPSYDG
ncbi:MAG: AraC family transcriptional regulator [Ktedonobacteraceae bacterium]